MESEPMLSPWKKIPSTGSFEEDQTRDAHYTGQRAQHTTNWATTAPSNEPNTLPTELLQSHPMSPTHYQLSYYSPIQWAQHTTNWATTAPSNEPNTLPTELLQSHPMSPTHYQLSYYSPIQWAQHTTNWATTAPSNEPNTLPTELLQSHPMSPTHYQLSYYSPIQWAQHTTNWATTVPSNEPNTLPTELLQSHPMSPTHYQLSYYSPIQAQSIFTGLHHRVQTSHDKDHWQPILIFHLLWLYLIKVAEKMSHLMQCPSLCCLQFGGSAMLGWMTYARTNPWKHVKHSYKSMSDNVKQVKVSNEV